MHSAIPKYADTGELAIINSYLLRHYQYNQLAHRLKPKFQACMRLSQIPELFRST
jgi:hypothetical protein